MKIHFSLLHSVMSVSSLSETPLNGQMSLEEALSDAVARDYLSRLRQPTGTGSMSASYSLFLSGSKPGGKTGRDRIEAAPAGGGGGPARLPKGFDPLWVEFLPKFLREKVLRRHTQDIRLAEINELVPIVNRALRDPRLSEGPIAFLDWISFRPLQDDVSERVIEMFYKLFGIAIPALAKACERMAEKEPLIIRMTSSLREEALEGCHYMEVIASIVAADHFEGQEAVAKLLNHPNAFIRWLPLSPIIKGLPFALLPGIWQKEWPRLEVDLASSSRVRQMSALTIILNFAAREILHATEVLEKASKSEERGVRYLGDSLYGTLLRLRSQSRVEPKRLAKTEVGRYPVSQLWQNLDASLKERRPDETVLYVSLLLAKKDPVIIRKLTEEPYNDQPIITFAILSETLAEQSPEKRREAWKEAEAFFPVLLATGDMEIYPTIRLLLDAFIAVGIMEAAEFKEGLTRPDFLEWYRKVSS